MGELTLLLVVILGAVLLWRGPKMLPKIGAALGRGVRDARQTAREAFDEPADGQKPPL